MDLRLKKLIRRMEQTRVFRARRARDLEFGRQGIRKVLVERHAAVEDGRASAESARIRARAAVFDNPGRTCRSIELRRVFDFCSACYSSAEYLERSVEKCRVYMQDALAELEAGDRHAAFEKRCAAALSDRTREVCRRQAAFQLSTEELDYTEWRYSNCRFGQNNNKTSRDFSPTP